MKPVDPKSFERNPAEAAAVLRADARPMIRSQMNGSDWLLLLVLALIWGGAFFFIGIAVRHVPPLTYVWLRLTIGAAGLWAWLMIKGERVTLPRQVWGSILLLALLNNALPFALFGWGQTHIASGLASILNATTPIWGVVVAHLLTRDERMNPRKLAGVLLGFGGVAVMIGPSLLSSLGTGALAQCRLRRRLVELCAGGRLGAPLQATRNFAPQRHHRSADRRRADDAARLNGRRPAVDARDAAA
jgi:uncharacterized membrane protein